MTQTKKRIPVAIANDMVMCHDNTIWKWYGYDIYSGKFAGWEKLPPIPTDEEYEVQKQERLEQELKWMEKQTERGEWSKK